MCVPFVYADLWYICNVHHLRGWSWRSSAREIRIFATIYLLEWSTPSNKKSKASIETSKQEKERYTQWHKSFDVCQHSSLSFVGSCLIARVQKRWCLCNMAILPCGWPVKYHHFPSWIKWMVPRIKLCCHSDLSISLVMTMDWVLSCKKKAFYWSGLEEHSFRKVKEWVQWWVDRPTWWCFFACLVVKVQN